MDSGPTPCILLVEDNPADVGLVKEALEEHGVLCNLVVISNGESAIDYIAGVDSETYQCPNLVILDLNLPRVPGAVVLQQLRRSEKCRNVQVAVLTSSDNQKDRDSAAAGGASRYIRKPSGLNEFIGLGRVFRQLMNSAT